MGFRILHLRLRGLARSFADRSGAMGSSGSGLWVLLGYYVGSSLGVRLSLSLAGRAISIHSFLDLGFGSCSSPGLEVYRDNEYHAYLGGLLHHSASGYCHTLRQGLAAKTCLPLSPPLPLSPFPSSLYLPWHRFDVLSRGHASASAVFAPSLRSPNNPLQLSSEYINSPLRVYPKIVIMLHIRARIVSCRFCASTDGRTNSPGTDCGNCLL